MVRGAVAVQRGARSHKLSVRLRAHWGRHNLAALNPPEVLLHPGTGPDGPAIEPKRNYPRMNLQHYLLKGVGSDAGAENGGGPLVPIAAGPQPIGSVTPQKRQQSMIAWKMLIGPRRIYLL